MIEQAAAIEFKFFLAQIEQAIAFQFERNRPARQITIAVLPLQLIAVQARDHQRFQLQRAGEIQD